jgi:hypothetical protein
MDIKKRLERLKNTKIIDFKNTKELIKNLNKIILDMTKERITIEKQLFLINEVFETNIKLNNYTYHQQKIKNKNKIHQEKITKIKNVAAPENETNKTIPKVVSKKVEESENSNEQTITKKLVLNLPTRKIKTGEIVRVDRSQFK